MAEDFPKLLKNIHPQTKNTKKKKPKKTPILRHIPIKLLKTKDKKKVLKSTGDDITLN